MATPQSGAALLRGTKEFINIPEKLFQLENLTFILLV